MVLPTRPAPVPLDPRLEAAAVEVLAAPPRPPRDPGLFTSNALFGEPGIYPDGPPMEPAAGDPTDEHLARAALGTLLPDHLGDAGAVAEGARPVRRADPPPPRPRPAPPRRPGAAVRHRRRAGARRGGRRTAGVPFASVTVAAMPDSGGSSAPSPTAPTAPGP